jgi:hypothetical protein
VSRAMPYSCLLALPQKASLGALVHILKLTRGHPTPTQVPRTTLGLDPCHLPSLSLDVGKQDKQTH